MSPVGDRPISFETHPDRYRHWKLELDDYVARLTMDVRENEPLDEGYELKLNSYDLGVDIELADAVRRLRFEHPEIRVIVISSAKDRVFCAGANIKMLGSSTHGFKVNFCKFTNETRLAIEDASRSSGQHWICAATGTTAGGGYELALACDEILLIDDGSSAVSLPEVPLLGVLPGTGGLTRLVDKRLVRRDRADVFCTVAEGIKGKRALQWGLVDGIATKSKFEGLVKDRCDAALAQPAIEGRVDPGVALPALEPTVEDDSIAYRHVTVAIDRAGRKATLTIAGPDDDYPKTADEILEAGSDLWHLRAVRELDDALLRLRFSEPEVGLVLVKTTGDPGAVVRADHALHAANSWFSREVLLLVAEVLRRYDCTAKSFFALIEPGSAFAGTLVELALGADRAYALDDPDDAPSIRLSSLNAGALPMTHGLNRIQVRHLKHPEKAAELAAAAAMSRLPGDMGTSAAAEVQFDPESAEEAGIVTIAADEIDYEDEVRLAIEERVSLSPDALTGMEANLRFPGAETMETKIFGRLSAWQNWIFQRPNAVGERGALTVYGEPQRPSFQWSRT